MSYSVSSPIIRQEFPAQLIPFPKSARSVRSEDPPAYDGIPSAPAREWRPMIPPDLYSAEIGVNAIAVYGVLAIYVNGKTGECYPSYAAITKRLGLSRKTVYLAIKQLEKFGFVLIEDRHKNGRSNVYTLPHQKHRGVAHDTPPVSQKHPSRVATDTPPMSPMTPELNVIEPNDIELDEEEETPLPPGGESAEAEPTYPPLMMEFWNAYPRVGRDRSSRVKVLAQWKKLKPDDELAAKILAGVESWKAKPDWIERFAPGAHKFLHERKWTEPPSTTPQVSTVRKSRVEEVRDSIAAILAVGDDHDESDTGQATGSNGASQLAESSGRRSRRADQQLPAGFRRLTSG